MTPLAILFSQFNQRNYKESINPRVIFVNLGGISLSLIQASEFYLLLLFNHWILQLSTHLPIAPPKHYPDCNITIQPPQSSCPFQGCRCHPLVHFLVPNTVMVGNLWKDIACLSWCSVNVMIESHCQCLVSPLHPG